MNAELNDGRILIRPVGIDDVDAIYHAARASIAEVYPFLPWCHPDYARDETASWVMMQINNWQQRSEFNFGVFDVATCKYLGGVGLNMLSTLHHYVNLGYWVKSAATGRGVATAATLLAARFGFAELEINRIEILASDENIASQRVAEKAGAMKEGVLRRRLWLHDRAHDAVMYSMVREEVV